MYAIVNQAIQNSVTEKSGADGWVSVKEKSSVYVDFFFNIEQYCDDLTYKLVGSESKVLEISIEQAWSNNLKAFLANLPFFHKRIIQTFPTLARPEFRATDIEENSTNVHYYSKMEQLHKLVRRLLTGVAKMHNVKPKLNCCKAVMMGIFMKYVK
jgi:hypothetical protein